MAKANFLDKVISAFSPKAGMQRAAFRAKEQFIRSAVRAYDGANRGRRGEGWTPGGGANQNQDIQRSISLLRERSVDGYKNNASVFKAIRTIQNGVVGTGIMPTPIPVPGQPKLSKADLNAIKTAWEIFVKTCDFDGVFHFYGLQTLAMRTGAMQGELFVVRQRDASNSPVPFKIQILEPHMCDHQKSGLITMRGTDNYIVQGVEFDARGRKVGYWMHEYNPNNEYVLKLAPKFVSVNDVVQIFYKEYPSQVRGIPFGTSAMLNMRDLADYEDAQLMLQKVSACHVGFTTQEISTDNPNIGDPGENDDLPVDHLEPGMITRMAPGETVTFNNPPTPQNFGEYVSKNQQKSAAGYGITYEQLTGDMGNVNFSSGRMGWIEAQRQIEDWQYNFFIPQFCDAVWKWFIEGLRINNIINRDVWADWTPPAREMLDPVKEMNGLILELSSGLVSWTEACKRRGYNPELLMAQLIADKELFQKNGINVEWIIENVAETPEEPSSNATKKSTK